MSPLNLCYYALALCILDETKSIQEVINEVLGRELLHVFDRKSPDTKKLTHRELEEILALREQKVIWREIGEIYGMDPKAIFARVKRYKEAVGI